MPDAPLTTAPPVGTDVEEVAAAGLVVEAEKLGVAVAVKVPFLLVELLLALPVPMAPVPTMVVAVVECVVVVVLVKSVCVDTNREACEELVTVNGPENAVAEEEAARSSGMTWKVFILSSVGGLVLWI